MKIVTCRLVLPAIVILAVTACATSPATVVDDSPSALTDSDSQALQTESQSPVVAAPEPEKSIARETISLGSGTFVQASNGSRGNVFASDEGVTLNFEKADLREFLGVIFDTILHENYFVDPQVKGSVTLHTTKPVTQAAVLPILETVLESNGVAMLLDDGIFKIVPLANAEGAASSPTVGRYASSRSVGYGIQVVPLEHVSASEIQSILGPLVPEGSTLRVDETRNVLILSGPQYRIDELLATIRTFDVDWLSGMSFGMFTLEYADAATMVEELKGIIGGNGASPLDGIVKLMPVERLNAVLVIAHRPAHIAVLQNLIEQFDRGVEGAGGRRLYVYELENGKAVNIARSLQAIFGTSDDSREADRAPRITGSDVFRNADEVTRSVPSPSSPNNISSNASQGSKFGNLTGDGDSGLLADSQGTIKIIADEDNNALLVLASQQDYRSIEAAIRRLDIAPRQVLIEATIAEVTLSNTLDYGVRWFLENSGSELGFNAPVPGSASGAGLAFAFFDQDSDLSAFFDILATESSVKFLSTPQVMVLDNQTATIRVGDQIPVTTRSSQSTTNPDAPIVTEVQFRDTGTLLTVTPRINAGGQVILEISQEVSLPGTEPAVGGGGNVSIAQRTINSSVIVQSGQTVVLGGLILENTNEGVSGIPGLMSIPWLGKLFSTTSQDVFRTELIVTVSPRVIENQRAMRQVTEELRQRMQKASQYESTVNQVSPDS
ncbi:MAG: general secretion pathway protein D [Woeseiaceae bacterium]|jgi:general secretion pathway protein D